MTGRPFLPVVAVVGCGLVGASWAALFAASGRDVHAWDHDPERRRAVAGRLAPLRRQLRRIGLVGRGRVRACETLEEAVADAGWIQENAPEKPELKRELLARIEAGAPKGATIGSSTSALLWSDISASMKKPGRLVVAHPFNPAHLMPLVEVYGPDDRHARKAMRFMRALGKVPVRMKKEAVGHLANRLSSALWREAVHVVAEGIADVADVDTALVAGPGLRWSVLGPHLAYHLGGGDGGIRAYLEHLGPSQERRWASLGTPSLTPQVKDALVAGVEAETQGRSIADLERRRDERLIATLNAAGGRARPGREKRP
jgi:3-hydroxyacyl-CoA dehydrogenase